MHMKTLSECDLTLPMMLLVDHQPSHFLRVYHSMQLVHMSCHTVSTHVMSCHTAKLILTFLKVIINIKTVMYT